jgi:hypothetical protein
MSQQHHATGLSRRTALVHVDHASAWRFLALLWRGHLGDIITNSKEAFSRD